MENERQIMQVIKMQMHLHCTFILCGQQQAGNWSGREYCQMSGVCMAVFAKKEILLGTVRLILVIKCEGEEETEGGWRRMRRWSTLVVQIMKDCGVNWC